LLGTTSVPLMVWGQKECHEVRPHLDREGGAGRNATPAGSLVPRDGEQFYASKPASDTCAFPSGIPSG
jgi:hypothetical protein